MNKVSINFSTCTAFKPNEDASGYVVQAYSNDTECWWYLANPKGIGYFTFDDSMKVCKAVALKGEIDLAKWSRTYPLSDHEAWELAKDQTP